MGTTLTGLTPATTYDALLKTTDNQPLTSTRKVITDGLGNDSALSLATTSASITGTLAISSTLTASNFSGTFSGTSSNTNTGDETNATIKSKLGAATTSVDGYLTATDWTIFNNKVATTRSISTIAPLSGGGDLSANRTLSITQATTSTDGYLSSTNWNTFNGKENVLTFSAPLSRATNTISIPAATTSVSGHLTSTDWNTFNNKIGGSGTTANIPLFNSSNTITNSDFYVKTTAGGTPNRQIGYFIDYINGVSPVNLYMGYNGIDNEGNAIYKTSIGENGFGTTFGDIYLGGSISLVNSTGNITTTGTLTSNTLSTNTINGVVNINGTGKLQIANIGASGTLNVGSTTTATKLLELTTATNTGGAQNNTLRFINNNTTISTNEQIGRIEFYSGDASTPGASVKAYISCNATSATPNAYIDFATDGTTGTPTVRQRIAADGKVLIGSTTDNTSTNRVQISGGLDYNIETGTYSASSSLLLVHKGRFVSTTSSSAINITIQPNSTVAFPVGSQVWIVQEGTGVPTIVAGTGVTLLTRSSSKQPFAQYSEIKLTKTATDTWYLTGDLKA